MLFYVVSVATGEIFAENLTGEGSARRWAESRGLTFDSLESEEEMAMHEEHRQSMIAQYESKKSEFPDQLAGIEAEINRWKAMLSERTLYVKEGFCRTVGFPSWQFVPETARRYGSPSPAHWERCDAWTVDFAD